MLRVDLRSTMEHIIFLGVPFKNKNDNGFFVDSAPYSNGTASVSLCNLLTTPVQSRICNHVLLRGDQNAESNSISG